MNAGQSRSHIHQSMPTWYPQLELGSLRNTREGRKLCMKISCRAVRRPELRNVDLYSCCNDCSLLDLGLPNPADRHSIRWKCGGNHRVFCTRAKRSRIVAVVTFLSDRSGYYVLVFNARERHRLWRSSRCSGIWHVNFRVTKAIWWSIRNESGVSFHLRSIGPDTPRQQSHMSSQFSSPCEINR